MPNDATFNQNMTPPDLAESKAEVSEKVIDSAPPPPTGDEKASEIYLNKIIQLIDEEKITVTHTDLQKFEIDSIQDHYRLDLGDYEVEVNHSKAPDSGQDFYIMLFNNLKKIEAEGQSCTTKVILAYIHLTESQFNDFKETADKAIEIKRKREEEKRFKEAMAPIDEILDDMGAKEPEAKDEPQEAKEADDFELAQEENNDESLPESPDFPPYKP